MSAKHDAALGCDCTQEVHSTNAPNNMNPTVLLSMIELLNFCRAAAAGLDAEVHLTAEPVMLG